MEGANGQDLDASPENDNYEEEIHRVKRGHVLGELLETERVYVTELRSIIEVSQKIVRFSCTARCYICI